LCAEGNLQKAENQKCSNQPAHDRECGHCRLRSESCEILHGFLPLRHESFFSALALSRYEQFMIAFFGSEVDEQCATYSSFRSKNVVANNPVTRQVSGYLYTRGNIVCSRFFPYLLPQQISSDAFGKKTSYYYHFPWPRGQHQMSAEEFSARDEYCQR
jgi:hypothetical protein